MNDMNATEFCENFPTADKGTLELKSLTAQSGIGAYAWNSGNWNSLWVEQVDAGELARRVAGEIKGQLDTIVRPEIEGKYKLKHR